MQDESLYDVLGVTPAASPEQIRLSFLNLAHQFHPDLSDNNAHDERFKQLRHAYEILSNPERREIYDRTHDSYATVIRQTAGLGVPKAKERGWTHRTSSSTFSFKTNWLKDRRVGRDRWIFFASTLASAAIVVWASQFISELRRTTTEQSHVAQQLNEAANNTAEVPANELPATVSNMKQYFQEQSPKVGHNVEPNRNGVDGVIESKPTQSSRVFLPSAQHERPEKTEEFVFQTQPSTELISTYYDTNVSQIASYVPSRLDAIPNSAPTVVVRPELNAEYFKNQPAPAHMPLGLGRKPIPTQAELSDMHSQLNAMPIQNLGVTRSNFGASNSVSPPGFYSGGIQQPLPRNDLPPIHGPMRGQHLQPGVPPPAVSQPALPPSFGLERF